MKRFIVPAVLLLLSACSEDTSQPAPLNGLLSSAPHPLHGQWRLVEITSQAGVNQTDALHEGYTLTLASDGGIQGQADCNFFFGDYSYTDGERLTVSQLATTRAACPLPSAWSLYIGVLQSARQYERMGDRLIITGVLDGRLVFETLAAD